MISNKELLVIVEGLCACVEQLPDSAYTAELWLKLGDLKDRLDYVASLEAAGEDTGTPPGDSH